ncbi:molybdopterin-dependent oxidoreductase [soil metagenome]
MIQSLLHELRGRLAAPSRGPRTAVVVGRLLAIAFLLCFATGLYSHLLQDPLPWMHFPTRPAGLYQLTQGIHITAGILCFPLITAKLYAVYPELFQTPPIRGFAHLLERASITLFVAASLVEIVSGLLNTYQWYALLHFPFRQTHFALSFVIIGSLAIHIAVKLPIIRQHWSTRADAAAPVGASAEPIPGAVIAPVGGVTGRVFSWIDKTPAPAQPRASRRAFLTTVGIAAGGLVLFTGGQSFRLLDGANLFGARKRGDGPQSLPVNRTAQKAKVVEAALSPDWVLTVTGATTRTFTRAQLKALPQHTVDLPIACVEGWSQLARWSGPRLRDLVELVGGSADATIRATSLEKGSIYAVMQMPPEFVRDELTLVALTLNGRDLDLDHGFPARMIAPARPGVLQTKWLTSLEVMA